MAALFQTSWMTILGLSLLFTGGFVTWVYGSPTKTQNGTAKYFSLYGVGATLLGFIFLVTSTFTIV